MTINKQNSNVTFVKEPQFLNSISSIRDDFENRYKITKDKQELRIRSVKFSDEGYYRCRVVNGFGHFDMIFQVQVFDPKTSNIVEYITKSERKKSAPRWLNETEIAQLTQTPIRLYDGESFILRCAAEGHPTPNIIWLKDGKVLHLLNEGRKTRSAEMLLRHVNSSMSGEYSCQLSNQYGVLNATFHVCAGKYRNARKCKIEHPEIDRILNTVMLGRTAEFICKFRKMSDNLLEPAIRWLKLVTDSVGHRTSNEIVYENKTFSILDQNANNVDHNGEEYINRLIIHNVRYEHAGTYVCAVQAGSSIMHTTTVLRVVASETESTFSSIYFYLGIPLMFIILIFVAYSVHFLHKNRQIEKTVESTGYAPDTVKSLNKLSYSLPPPPLVPPPQVPVNPYMSQHSFYGNESNQKYLTQDMICNQSMQQKCFQPVPSLNLSKRLVYQTCINPTSQYAIDSVSNFYESTPNHFHSSQTLPASARIDPMNFDPEYLRGRRPCPTEVDDYNEQRQPFLSPIDL
uniref:Ig-like domain-containing protein n=1 Tax=Syphacia muris TaxID=451379 RepID=A0A0N5A8H9_9BILA